MYQGTRALSRPVLHVQSFELEQSLYYNITGPMIEAVTICSLSRNLENQVDTVFSKAP
jgi:hypothetical protein